MKLSSPRHCDRAFLQHDGGTEYTIFLCASFRSTYRSACVLIVLEYYSKSVQSMLHSNTCTERALPTEWIDSTRAHYQH
jgi:hypothetical protein